MSTEGIVTFSLIALISEDSELIELEKESCREAQVELSYCLNWYFILIEAQIKLVDIPDGDCQT